MRPDALWGFVRLGLGLRRFLRAPLSIEAAQAQVREALASREPRFLAKLERVVFANPHSPYLQLCRWAGIEFGDIEALVRSDGLEGALQRLRAHGVHVDWEEFKARKPLRRGSQSLDLSWWMFNNPMSRTDFEASTGGSSGASMRVAVDLDNDAEAAVNWALLFDAHGLMTEPLLFWTPNHVGVASRFLKCSRFGKDMERWYVMARMTEPGEKLKSMAIHALVRTMAGYPRPVDAPLAEPRPVLDALYALLDQGRKPAVNTSPSAAATLGALALERGRPLAGVRFLLGAEPVTLARHEAILASGATPIPTYGTSEAGAIAAAFASPNGQTPAGDEEAFCDRVQIFKDAFAIITDRQEEASAAPAPRARDAHGNAADRSSARASLLFTNLRASAPKVLFNTEIGDEGVMTEETGCMQARAYGYDQALHTIRSFRKVTVWGATLAVADLADIVERDLPTRFGGGHADYQLCEEEDATGRPRLRLLVDPRVGPFDADAMRTHLLEAIARRGSTYGYMVEEIRSTKSLVIERRSPELTGRGKLLPVLTRRAS